MKATAKPWYQSQTIVCIVAALIVQIARRYGIDLVPADAQEIGALLIDLLSAILAGAAIHGRIAAKSVIGAKPGKSLPVIVPALLLLAALSMAGPIACASREASTPAQIVFAAKGDFASVLPAVRAYVVRADAQPTVKKRLQELTAAADDSLDAAEAAVRAGDDPKIPAAITAASHAVQALVGYLHEEGVLQ